MPLEIFALGKLTLSHQAHSVTHFPTKQVEELLGYLLLNPKRYHSREKLITLLWPDVSLENGRHRFSIVLSRIRKLFQQLHLPIDGFIETTRQDVAFVSKRPFSFDRDQFLITLQQAKETLNLEKKEYALRRAISLCQGELLEGIYAEWCLVEREALERQRLYTLGQLMHCCQKRSAYEEAITLGQTILMDDPLREEVHRALIECYAIQGRVDQVSKQYEMLTDLLNTELRSLPHPSTIQVYRGALSDVALQKQAQWLTDAQRTRLETAVHAFQHASHTLIQLLREF